MISRRTALMIGAAGTVGAAGAGMLALRQGDPPEVAAPPTLAGKSRWSNWSGMHACVPDSIAVPGDLNELRDVIVKSKAPIRPVGAGHSFTPLVPTDGTILSLDRMNGVAAHDERTVTVDAGIRLFALGEQLERLGQSMSVLPDINKQSLAGALATATHGTGASFGSLAEHVRGLQLMTADGNLVECDNERAPEFFHAALVSLGALGVVTQVRLQNRAALRLERRTWFEPIDEAIATAQSRSGKHRHYEFYYLTFTGMAYCISHDETAAAVTPREKNPENDGAEQLMTLRDWFAWAPSLRRMIAQGLIANQDAPPVVGPAWRLLSTDRPKRFNEMEYHVPRDALTACLREVITAIERHNEVYFPIEVRFIAPDTAWLSPFYNRTSVSIAVHMGHTQNHRFFYTEIEPIFRRFDGRPHWGKLHTLGARDLATLYPQWSAFTEVRRRLDPAGLFLNEHLRKVFSN